jgi:transposase
MMTASQWDSYAVRVRDQRGRHLASTATIKRIGSLYAVPSQTQPTASTYFVDIVDATCTCEDYKHRHQPCKHYAAVMYWIAWGRDVGEAPPAEVKKPRRRTYAQEDWSLYNASQTWEKTYFERLLKALCEGIEQPPRKPGAGRNPTPLKEQTFAAVMKVFVGLSGRRAQSDIRECVEKGHISEARHFNTIFNFLGDEATTPLLTSLVEEASRPLRVIEDGQYAVDSTGFSTVYYDRWFDQKHGRLAARHPWIKLHICIGTATHAITALSVTSAGDSTQMLPLVERTRQHHDVREVSADKAYSTVDNLEKLEACGIQPFIPFKENAAINPKSPTWSRHLVEFVFNKDKFDQHYHRRSNVETAVHMIKSKFDAKISSRRPVAQINEVLAKCLCHNLVCVVKAIFMSGLAPRFWPDAPRSQPALTLVQP